MKRFFSKVVSRSETISHSVSWVMSIIAALVLCIMMLLTVVDVAGRYFFMSPIKGGWELTGLLLIPAATWGMAQCQINKHHIRVKLVLDRFSPKVQAIVDSFAYLLGLGIFSILSWQMVLFSIDYILVPVGGTTEILGMPFFPFTLILASGAGIMAVILLLDLLHSLAKVASK